MHILPQLRKLERKHRDTLAVIGVHSAKFTNEKETANVREAVMRYGIEHPVANDRDFKVWQAYSVRAWPTLMFIDPLGRVIGKHEGEFQFEALDRIITAMTAEFEAGGILDRKPLPFQLEAEAASARTLSFPGKLLADPAGNRLFVSDSGHNRILIVTPLDAAHDRGETPHVIVGTGEPGADDGPIATASFSNPQGLALDGDTLYVADAGNHTIRAVNLRERLVTTIAGTGEQALYRHKGGLPLANPLNSPYDLAVRDGMLYIAMAGFHQLWAIDLAASSIAPFAGDGREDIVDGPRLEARLAQPYGLALSGDALYFADSETSAVRAVRPVALNEKTVPGPSAPPASVTTLIGAGLFDFGDRDGAGSEARLQHCQGVAAGDGRVFIADTYNHKVKSLDIASQQVTTLAGTGRAGKRDGPAAGATFNEPAGLSYADGRVYIADTNNHAVRVLNLASMTVSTLGL